MTDLTRLLPTPGVVPAAELVTTLAKAQENVSPFHREVVSFAGNLSRAIRRDERLQSVPAYAAAGYWLRPANISKLRAAWDRYGVADPEVVRAPRGVVFHIPPSNVPTLFLYSWILSALAGNANVVRLSPHAVRESVGLVDTIAMVLAKHPAVAATTAVVTYDRDREITATLSQVDVRVHWGGDDSINVLRAIPSAPRTHELVFPDRFSMALFDAFTVATAPADELARLANLFYVDAYTFDQMACSSPRLVVWRGDPITAERASGRFRAAVLDEVRRRDHTTSASSAIAKLVQAAAGAVDGVVTSVDWGDNSMTVVGLASLTTIPRDGPGGGLFYETSVEGLDGIPPHLRRRDQTIVHYGFDRDALIELARLLGAHGVERIVPVGSALTFDHHWDGHDLLLAFSRAIHVPIGAPSMSIDRHVDMPEICDHAFNSAWLGVPMGISHGPVALRASRELLRTAGAGFHYVEVRCPATELPLDIVGPTNGLIQIDTQLSYVLALRYHSDLPRGVRLVRASEGAVLNPADFEPFRAERYARIPGVTDETLAARYARWSEALVRSNPDWCARVERDGEPAGYVFAEPDEGDGGAMLTLAVASRGSTVPGMAVYAAAACMMRENGARRAHSTFSALNVPALNVHTQLGCRFTNSTLVYLLDMAAAMPS